MPKTESITVSSTEELSTYLEGCVFHITLAETARNIIITGEIQNNLNGDRHSPFGYNIGFFRKNGCVSFFDYRNEGAPPEDGWDFYRNKCHPIMAFQNSHEIAVFFLKEPQYKHLISWKVWEEEKAYSQNIVPYVEVGLKGNVLLSDISKIYFIRFIRKCD